MLIKSVNLVHKLYCFCDIKQLGTLWNFSCFSVNSTNFVMILGKFVSSFLQSQIWFFCKKNPCSSTRSCFLVVYWSFLWLQNLGQSFITVELFQKSPAFSRPISSAFTPYPIFHWYLQSNEILLNLGMKCI
jgi:hypothetical protein